MKKTFRIGGVHPHDNKISREAAVEVFPAIETAWVSMAQHLGAPATPVVAVGDKVKVGQVIAEPAGFISGYVHSPVSGTVKSVGPRADIAGNMVPHVEITVEGDEWMEDIDTSDTIVKDIPYTPEEIIEKVKKAGVVGLGGASFPTHVKLAPPKDKKAECVILNGTECEPYLTSYDRIMRERPMETTSCSVQFSRSVVPDSLRPHESQHARPPCHHHLLEFTQTHVHRVGEPSHPLSSPFPLAPNPSQHQSLFQ